MLVEYTGGDLPVQIKHHKILIEEFRVVLDENVFASTIFRIHLLQWSYRVEVDVYHSNFSSLIKKELFNVIFKSNRFGNLILINHCIITSIMHKSMFLFMSSGESSSILAQHHLVKFTNCKFIHNYVSKNALINVMFGEIDVVINNCIFKIGTFQAVNCGFGLNITKLLISNTSFSAINCTNPLIKVSKVLLQLKGPIIITKINIARKSHPIISVDKNIEFRNYIEISNSITHGEAFIQNYRAIDTERFIVVHENTLIIINNNIYQTSSMIINLAFYLPCYFQFTSDRGNLDDEFSNGAPLNYSIVISNDSSADYLEQVMIHCYWLPGSAFNTTSPYEVYKRFVKTDQPLTNERLICYCVNDSYQDCHTHVLATIYPGQVITPSFVLNQRSINMFGTATIISIEKRLPITACILVNIDEMDQPIHNYCSSTKYTIVHSEFSDLYHWCKLLFLLRSIKGIQYYNLFYINFYSCPPGFVQLNGACACDPLLSSELLSITTCDITHQTILRPANTWLSAITIISSHQYHISPHCPLQYCLPYSSQLNFSTPNSQCQFNRSGLLCGQCQQGLSTVFGSSQCQHCNSNYYLFLIIPFAIAGLVLVLLLFTLNLTITDGDINGFILYVNIISINSHVFFPVNHSIQPSYTFVSIANLDLGIETCFYNGMDDYAKMWLQLVFPTYLIFIATSLIIASRHSTRIQRITARRALPVLSTLFLLTYTKILHTVSSVLFYYSTITHLPSKHTRLVWAVDATVPLFGVRFTFLFIACLILFLILLLLNAVLIFTKTFLQFSLVSRFQLMINAFQGPHKYKYYYWTGVQLVIRAVFFGLSALDRNINLTIGVILLVINMVAQTDVVPFKKKAKHYNELSFLLNLLIIYTLSFGDHEVGVNIMITIGAVQLVIIIIYHIITNVCGEVTIYTNIINAIIRWITRQNHPPQQIHDELNNTPPDKTYNYLEYREPLVGVD